MAFFVSVGQCPGLVLTFVSIGVVHSVCSHMAVGVPGLTLSSGIQGYFMRCRPMCLQRVHYSVSVAFVGLVVFVV